MRAVRVVGIRQCCRSFYQERIVVFEYTLFEQCTLLIVPQQVDYVSCYKFDCERVGLVGDMKNLSAPLQCSEPSSPSVLEVGPDGPPVVVRLFLSPWTDYGNWDWDWTACRARRALWNFLVWITSAVFLET